MDNNNLIQIEDVKRVYTVGETEVNALRGVSYNIKKGGLVAIMGPSGSGKSTLMNIIGCLDKPSSGKYLFEGEEVSTFDKNKLAQVRNKKIGFVFQSFNLLSRTTALENTELPLVYSDVPRKKAREMAMNALAQVGLKGRELHKTNQISGGEMQRVAICRAVINNPKIIFADEPTGNLDSENGKAVLDLLLEFQKEHRTTLVLVTHSVDIARIADRMIILKDGRIT